MFLVVMCSYSPVVFVSVIVFGVCSCLVCVKSSPIFSLCGCFTSLWEVSCTSHTVIRSNPVGPWTCVNLLSNLSVISALPEKHTFYTDLELWPLVFLLCTHPFPCPHSSDWPLVPLHRQTTGRATQVQEGVVQCDALCGCICGHQPC